MVNKMPLSDRHTLDDALSAYREGRVSLRDLHDWLPGWCIGKISFRYRDGQLEELCTPKYKEAYWLPVAGAPSENINDT